MDKKAAVVANTLYANDVLVAKDIKFTLPEVACQTADVQAMGTLSLPLIGLLENMELAITQVGLDVNTSAINKLEKQTFEFRWVQEKVDSEGNVKAEGCKAFIRTVPGTGIPGLAVENGSVSELEGTYNVTRYQLFVDGEEVLLVDRIAGILKVNGTDYYKDVSGLL